MQSRVIGHLARKLRSTHRKTKSWKQTAELHHVFNSHGEINKGLAMRIAVQEYEPGPEVFERLLKDGALQIKRKPRQRLWRDLFSLTQQQLTYLLEHREDFRDEVKA